MKPEELNAWYDAEKGRLSAELLKSMPDLKRKKAATEKYHKKFRELNKKYAERMEAILKSEGRIKKRTENI